MKAGLDNLNYEEVKSKIVNRKYSSKYRLSIYNKLLVTSHQFYFISQNFKDLV